MPALTVRRFLWNGLLLAAVASAELLLTPAFSCAQQPKDSVLMATLQRFKADTVYHVRLDARDSTVRIFYGSVPLVQCRFTVDDRDDLDNYRDDWLRRRKTGWRSVTTRKVWSGRPAVSDTVVEVVARVSKVNPDLISRVMPRRFVVDLSEDFMLRVMTIEGAGEERSFREKVRSFSERWVPFMRRPYLDILVSDKDAQTLYYALEPGTPVVVMTE